MFYNYVTYHDLIRGKLNRTEQPKLLKERLSLDYDSLYFESGHFLFDVFDRKIQQYFEADLINYNNRYFFELDNPKKFEKFKEPFAVLTLDQLEAGFVVCLVPLVLSIFVFGIECLITLKNLIVFNIIFAKYFYVKDIEQKKRSGLMKNKFEARQASADDDTKLNDLEVENISLKDSVDAISIID